MPGPAGAKGDKGEVSNQQLDDANGGTANNVNGVDLLDADPDLATVAAKLNELISAPHR